MNTVTHKKSMPDRLEVKYYEFTVQILPPPIGAPKRLGKKNVTLRAIYGPSRFNSVYALVMTICFANVYF